MVKRSLSAAYKVLFALLGLGAVVTEVITIVHRGNFDAGNFFSFFTILSNIFASLVLLASAFLKKSHTLAMFRGAAVVYMATTGLVFSALLSGLEDVVLTAVPLDNTILHYIMPIAVVLDWIIDTPHAYIRLKRALWWLAFPLAYVAYSLVRGKITGWYPYPFLDPANRGYFGVAVVSVCVGTMVLLLIWAFAQLAGRSEHKRAHARHS